MHKLHVTALALLLGGAAVLGTIAVARTTGLGSAARQTNDAAVAARAKQLTAYAAKLRQQLKSHPPALPPLPKKPAPAAQTASAPRIVYQQPPPVVVTVHKHHGDDGSYEADGGGGGGGDD
jgi:hypothetical protein